MIIDTKKIEKLLSGDYASMYRVSKETGISQSLLSALKNDERDISSLTMENAKKLQDYFEKVKTFTPHNKV